MTANRGLFSGVLLGALASVAISASAQPMDSYVLVEERSNYYGPAEYYIAPRITVERRFATEDMLITDDVKSALDGDPRIDPSRIAVETDRNVVMLSGLVPTPGQAIIAARDAQLVPGVREVRNYLRSRVGDVSAY